MKSHWMAGGLVAAVVLLLSACSGPTQDDLAVWMSEQRATVNPRVEPVSAPVPFTPQAYRGMGAMSPFSEEKLTVLLRAESASPLTSSLIAAEMTRRKEPLEAVPLDVITMVGILQRGNERVALVRSDNLLYQVRTGAYMGQNFGRVTGITETQISLREIVQDAAGEWIERTSTLQLQEVAGP
jgi:type IV pilus assembly protein PilP